MIEGPSIDEHHLIPKTFKGKEKVKLHRVCHSKIHSVFTERELLNHYHTIERLISHVEIQKFIKWVSKKEPEFYTHNEQVSKKKRR